MSIYITDKDGKYGLAPYSYKKTLIKAGSCFADSTIAWLEGVDMQMKTPIGGFSSCGGAINTNTGITLTKENLQEILDNLPEGGVLKVASCNRLILSERDKRDKSDKTVMETFAHDNRMVQCNSTTFALGEEGKQLWLIEEAKRQEIASRTPKLILLRDLFDKPEGTEIYVYGANVGVKGLNYEKFSIKVNRSKDKQKITSLTLLSTSTTLKLKVEKNPRWLDDKYCYIHRPEGHSLHVTFYTAPENAIEDFSPY